MAKKIASVRGMHDILPGESYRWQFVESCYQAILQGFAYKEIRFPILEETQLFKRSVGEVTDIVEKEMYTFLDRNEESVTLRPEGTAGCVRAAEQHGLLYNQTQRLFYSGPMFRHERPQKGRARQFHQLGVEAFGFSGTDIEIELILLSAEFFRALGVLNSVTLEINSIGSSEERAAFGKALTTYLSQHKSQLDADSQKRLESNPLRILDSKDANTQSLLVEAPKLKDYLSEDSRKRFADLKAALNELGIAYQERPSLVRGLDYYNDLVFEWTSTHLGAQATVCAGGRYDRLVETLGGKSTPAVGFALGMERLILLMETLGLFKEPNADCDIFIAYVGEKCELEALRLSMQIREAFPDKIVLLNCGGSGLKSQLKKADKSGAPFALILGEQELEAKQIQLKYLRKQQDSLQLSVEHLISKLRDEFLTSKQEV